MHRKTSKQAKERIKRAREKKGWTVESRRPLKEASKVLNPNWKEGDPLPDSVSSGNWRRFLYATTPIKLDVFKAFSQVLELDWKEIAEDDNLIQPATHGLFSAYEENWVGREELISQLSQKLRGQCRVLVITGITGQGKTALAARLAVELQEDWPQYKYVNFADGIPAQDFTTAADYLLTQLGEKPTADERKDAEHLLNILVQKLQSNRYLVLIDSLEVLLKGKVDDDLARNEFQDERWWRFFSRLLASQDCQSRLILTSQDLPTQFRSCRYRLWDEESLEGLNEAEQLELFQKLFQRDGREIEPESEAADYLKRMGNAYEGHPLVLEVIVGEILARQFNGNVVEYWHRYRQEFENIEPVVGHQQLQLRVKDRVKKCLERLRQDVPYAHTLLCRSSVYRCPVPEAFWLEMLWVLSEQEKAAALETLKYRYLVIEEEVTSTGQYPLRQHNLIRSVAHELLRKIANQGPEWKDVHCGAAKMWLMAHKPEPNAPNLEKVRGFLEAFYHLCEIEAWEEAREILFTRLNTPTDEALGSQLSTWGYYQELADLYQKLLGKFNPDFEAVILNDLGIAYSALGDYPKAIHCYHKSMTIKQSIQEHSLEGSSVGNLGEAHLKLGNYVQAINYFQQSYEIKPRYELFLGIGNAYLALGYLNKAQEQFEQALLKACESKDNKMIGSALASLGIICRHQGRYEQAIENLKQSLIIAQQIEDPFAEGEALGNLSNVYAEQGDYAQAIYYQQQRLSLARQIKNPYGEVRALFNLAYLCTLQENYNRAIECQKQSLATAKKIFDRQGEAYALLGLGTSLIQVEEFSEALENLQQALEIFREIQHPMGEWNTLGNIGDVYAALGNHIEAISHYNQSLTITQLIQYRRGQEQILNRLMQVYYTD